MTAGRLSWAGTALCIAGTLLAGADASAQLSLSSAVDLALRSNPRVKVADADVAKALAVLQESRDVYIPAVSVGAGLGNSYGYSPYPPTLFTSTAQSLVYNGSQYSYIRSARAGFNAAKSTSEDVREAVTEDTVLTFAALDRDQQRREALQQQSGYAEQLVAIVQDRLASGFDTKINLTTAQLLAAQVRLNLLRAEDETENDRSHLASLIGLPRTALQVQGGLPALPASTAGPAHASGLTPGVTAAFATAKAKQAQAFGDSRFLYRPQISLILQYNRYATFTNSFKQLQDLNKNLNIGANEEVYGVQINLPLFDKFHKAKARESAADAAHALHEAEGLQLSTAETLARLNHTVAEQQARTEVAGLEQQLAQQQLDALLVQVTSANSNGVSQVTPKDAQNSRIAERDKYLAVVEATLQLRQAQISLLRQTGHLQDWVQSATIQQHVPSQ